MIPILHILKNMNEQTNEQTYYHLCCYVVKSQRRLRCVGERVLSSHAIAKFYPNLLVRSGRRAVVKYNAEEVYEM